MYRVLYEDDMVNAIGIVDEKLNELTGLIVTFKSIFARRVHYKTNSGMFVYKGRWFKGYVEEDQENVIYMNVESYGYILVNGGDVNFKQVWDLDRL